MFSAGTRSERQTTRSPTMAELALASRRLGALSLPRFQLLSPDFKDGSPLPTRATVDGDGTPPALAWELEPRPASFVLVCEDPDAPRATPYVHWIVYGIAGSVQSLDANLNDFRQGKNDQGQLGFAPAAPPPGDRAHRYVFQLFALDTELDAPPGCDLQALVDALSGHVIAWAELVGLYKRL